MAQLFKYKEDRLPVLLIVALFLADLLVYFIVDNVVLALVWMLLALGPKACICSWNHHHQHVATFTHTLLNRFLELVYGFHTGISTNAWVLHHVLGHHVNYLDQSKDESKWARPDGSTMGVVEYTLYTAFHGYLKAYKVGRKHPRYQRTFLSMGTILVLLLGVLVFFKPINGLLIFALPMLVGYVVTCWHTYYHHAGLDTDDHLEASYNIMHKWYNILTGNLGYHTAHHMKQGYHWSKLPEFHASIVDQIPRDLYREPCIPFKWMPAN
jgi:fatty acid desaturase